MGVRNFGGLSEVCYEVNTYYDTDPLASRSQAPTKSCSACLNAIFRKFFEVSFEA